MPPVPKLLWDLGTAYDLFISLEVLNNPSDFGMSGSWISSVRKRLPPSDREVLKQGLHIFHIPFHWVYSLPIPKDAITVLYTLRQIPPADRLANLTLMEDGCQIDSILKEVAAQGSWSQSDLENLHQAYSCQGKGKAPSKEKMTQVLEGWSRSSEFGELFYYALKTYIDVFFSEEEERIRPALKLALSQAQSMAHKLELPDLLEELSQGLRFEEIPELDELVLAPSYWVTPLMYLGVTSPGCGIWLFGARPGDQSLVPGETVPDSLMRGLKALSDPTRLRILHYLAQEPLSPAALSRRLRLRPPTVTHHLHVLRLAGLVQVRVGGGGKEKKSYAARTEAVKAACAALNSFITHAKSEEDGIEC